GNDVHAIGPHETRDPAATIATLDARVLEPAPEPFRLVVPDDHAALLTYDGALVGLDDLAAASLNALAARLLEIFEPAGWTGLLLFPRRRARVLAGIASPAPVVDRFLLSGRQLLAGVLCLFALIDDTGCNGRPCLLPWRLRLLLRIPGRGGR